MAVVKRGPGHCLALCCILLLLAVGGHAARNTIDVVKGSNEGPKTPPHAEPPPAPDQGAHPDNPAQKQPQQLAASDGVRAGYLAEADLRDQRLGGSSFEDQQRLSTAAGRAAQQEPEPQQRFRGAGRLAEGTVRNPEQEPEVLLGAAQDQKSQSTGSKGAAGEGLQQPKALHDEQFPGNGAQGDHEKPDKQLQAASVQAQQPKGLKDAAQMPEKQRQASSFEVIGGESGQEANQLSATLKRLEDLRGVEKTPGQEEQVPEGAVQKDETARSVEKANTKLNPLQGVQELIKAMKDRWRRHKAELQRAQEREARRLERQYLLALRAREKGERAARRASRAKLIAAEAEAQKKAKEAAEDKKKKADESSTKEKGEKEDKEQYQRGVEMLDAAVALEEFLQGPDMSEHFRALRTEGRARDGTSRRGILIPTGGVTLINHAYASISVLRNTLNCTLPIELVYNGEFEMNNRTCQRFETDFEDVRCIDAAELDYYPAHHRAVSLKKEEANAKGAKADTEGNKDTTGFQFKIFALCYITTFDEVLMLDADNLPLRNPEALFETREYRRSGTLFFSDWWDMTEWVKPHAYTAFGLPYPGDEAAILAAESGQLFINRNLHADALEWLWFVNSHSEVIYKLMYGDKDTFRLAFALAGKSNFFEQVSIPPSCPLDASSTNAEPVTYLHAGMIQHDPSGIPTFLHRTAEGKVYPFNNGYRKAHYMTVPLSSRRAAGVLGHDFKKMGLRGDQIDHATYQNCSHPVPQTFHAVCGVSLKSGTYPVPVIPVADIADLAPILDASYAVHDRLQHTFHTTFVMG